MTAPETIAATAPTVPEQAAHQPPAQAALSEPLFTVHEIARALRVSPGTVLRRIRAGELKAIRVGREWRVTRTEWSAYFAGLAAAFTAATQAAITERGSGE